MSIREVPPEVQAVRDASDHRIAARHHLELSAESTARALLALQLMEECDTLDQADAIKAAGHLQAAMRHMAFVEELTTTLA